MVFESAVRAGGPNAIVVAASGETGDMRPRRVSFFFFFPQFACLSGVNDCGCALAVLLKSSRLLRPRFVRENFDRRRVDPINMPPDRVRRRLRIAGLQSVDDRDISELSLLDRAWLRDSRPAVIEHERIEISNEVCEQRVAAAAIDREMKLP